jgi:hypothetical protein
MLLSDPIICTAPNFTRPMCTWALTCFTRVHVVAAYSIIEEIRERSSVKHSIRGSEMVVVVVVESKREARVVSVKC